MDQEKPNIPQEHPRNASQKTLVIILLIILPLIGFFLGTTYKQNKNTPSTNETNIAKLNKRIAQKEEEIQLLLSDSAKTGDTSKSTYSFQSLGVYSPLFENKDVTNREYVYKRQLITEKNLTIEKDSQKNTIAGVSVWEYTRWNKNSNESDNPYVVFGGYENYGNHPTTVKTSPENKESFINSNNIKMYWGYRYCPKSICTVTLTFFSNYTPSGHPVYVELWASNPSYLEDNSQGSAGISQTKEKLKKIADTVETSSTYH